MNKIKEMDKNLKSDYIYGILFQLIYESFFYLKDRIEEHYK